MSLTNVWARLLRLPGIQAVRLGDDPFLTVRTRFAKEPCTMSKWKRMWAGLFVSCACGAILLGMARATPPKGVISNILEGPFAFDEIDIRARTPSHGRPQWKARIITQGLSDGYFQRIKLAPGGESGWHSHPWSSLRLGPIRRIDGVRRGGSRCSAASHPRGYRFHGAPRTRAPRSE
jgi:hypothetical protein